MDNVFHSKEQCDISLVKGRLLETDVRNWRYEVQNKPKLRTYIQFKSEIDTEEYVYLSCKKDVVLYMRNCAVEYCLCVLKLADMMVSPWKIGHVNFVVKMF